MIKIGLDRLRDDASLQNKITGNIALLCHSASVDSNLKVAPILFKKIFGDRFKKLFGPQHGFVSDVQDNMVETDHYTHPFFQVPVYSLYSETRKPTKEMLEGIDTFVVDLQDVGTRVYTYITTVTYLLEECSKQGIKVVILDRPNPVGLEKIEGNILETEFRSFVGALEIPQRHALSMGEYAKYAKKKLGFSVELEVIEVQGLTRSMFWQDTGLEWINPSPNLPTPQGAHTFCGTVLYEGTNLSEGRGTTRALEVIGHPAIEAYSFVEGLSDTLDEIDNNSFILRPVNFMPTFNKHAGVACGGVHIHVTDPAKFNSWHVSQYLCREFKRVLGDKFEWDKKDYEYAFGNLAIDLINGSLFVKEWVERLGSMDELISFEKKGHKQYLEEIKDIKIYK
ncbi:exo-beta-N-acetylmuramidase NamZ domain-containing protein [Halobacteriovorax sp.]|uniref:exo-beta-N-acetylmuramidase NamZ family protein n=1 Tax=Halobacteriovorax sp. TaxID=2020862 RepID=UPI003AF2A761